MEVRLCEWDNTRAEMRFGFDAVKVGWCERGFGTKVFRLLCMKVGFVGKLENG